jgi:hypothetical protein
VTYTAQMLRRELRAITSIAALFGVVLLEGLSASLAHAQATRAAASSAVQHHIDLSYDPADFDKYVGYYIQSDPVAFAHVFRYGDHYYLQLNVARPEEIFPESATEFSATAVSAEITFVISADGQVSEMILHQNGGLNRWATAPKAAYDAFETTLKERIRDNQPSPGTEAAIRLQIAEWAKTGHALYAEMTPLLAASEDEQSPLLEAMFKQLGPLESLRFVKVLPPNGHDDYIATFAHGKLETIIGPLTSDGRITLLEFRALP